MDRQHCRGQPPLGTAHRTVDVLLILGQVMFLVMTRLVQVPVIIDDAHIHFRVADNFAQGHGLLYNVGERALTTTSPVYAGLLGVLGFLSHLEIPRLANLLNFSADLGSVLLGLLLMSRAGVPMLFRHAAILVVSSEPITMYHSAAGMEMSLYVFAALLTLALLQRDRWIWGGSLLGILGWIRPEAAAFALALGAGLWATGRRATLTRAVATASASAVVMGLVLWVQCGDVIPLSIRIKTVAPWFTEHKGSCAALFAQTLGELTPLHPLARHYMVWGPGGESVHMGFLCLLQVGLMILGARRLWCAGQELHAITLPLWAFGHWAFYAIANPCHFAWYLVPLLWISLLLGGLGAWEIILLWFGQREPFPRPGRRFPLMVRVSLAIAYAGFGLTVSAHRSIETPVAALGPAFRGNHLREALTFRFSPLAPGRLEPDYIAGAELFNQWIGENTEMRVGLYEIGVFGRLCRGRILDSCGLVSPEVISYLEQTGGVSSATCKSAPPPQMYLALRPELLALPPFYEFLLPAEFDQVYTAVTVPGVDMLLFVRSDLEGIVESVRRATP